MICRITVVDGAMKIAGMSHKFSPKDSQLFRNSLKVAGKKHANGMKKKVIINLIIRDIYLNFSHPTKTSPTSLACSSISIT